MLCCCMCFEIQNLASHLAIALCPGSCLRCASCTVDQSPAFASQATALLGLPLTFASQATALLGTKPTRIRSERSGLQRSVRTIAECLDNSVATLAFPLADHITVEDIGQLVTGKKIFFVVVAFNWKWSIHSHPVLNRHCVFERRLKPRCAKLRLSPDSW